MVDPVSLNVGPVLMTDDEVTPAFKIEPVPVGRVDREEAECGVCWFCLVCSLVDALALR